MQIRLSLTTNDLEASAAFYERLLALKRLAQFSDHDGYSGIILGTEPHAAWQLELVAHQTVNAEKRLQVDQALVVYCSEAEFSEISARASAFSTLLVENHNPYWRHRGALTLLSPDHDTIIIVPGTWNAGVDKADA